MVVIFVTKVNFDNIHESKEAGSESALDVTPSASFSTDLVSAAILENGHSSIMSDINVC